MTTETDAGGYTFDAVGCRSAWVIRKQSALVFGTQLWAIKLVVDWCYALGVVRSIEQHRYVECCGSAWAFDRWITTEYDGPGGASARSYVQAQFKYSLAWFQGGKAPWISITVHGDGTADRTWG